MKHTKVFLILLAVVAAFTFAACSDDEQDVNIVDRQHTSSRIYCTVTGSYTLTGESTAKTLAETWGYVEKNYATSSNSNQTKYTLYTESLYYVDGTAVTNTSYRINSDNSNNYLYQVGSKYYNRRYEDVTSKIFGSLDDGSFSYTITDSFENTYVLTFAKID